jgi:hypothetical protein
MKETKLVHFVSTPFVKAYRSEYCHSTGTKFFFTARVWKLINSVPYTLIFLVLYRSTHGLHFIYLFIYCISNQKVHSISRCRGGIVGGMRRRPAASPRCLNSGRLARIVLVVWCRLVSAASLGADFCGLLVWCGIFWF